MFVEYVNQIKKITVHAEICQV